MFMLAPVILHYSPSPAAVGMAPFAAHMTHMALLPLLAHYMVRGRESLVILLVCFVKYSISFASADNPFDSIGSSELWGLFVNGFVTQFFPIWILLCAEDETKMYLGLFRTMLETSEGKNHEKTVFISRMSHELRTPLHGLLSSVGLLRQTIFSTEQVTLLDTIDLCGDVLLNVIFKILDITRIESGDFQQAVSNFSLFELVSSVGDLLVGLAEKKGIDLNIQFDLLPEGYDVSGDAPRVKDALLNVRRPVFSLLYPLSSHISPHFLVACGKCHQVHRTRKYHDAGREADETANAASWNIDLLL